eukprot:gene7472-7681_t
MGKDLATKALDEAALRLCATWLNGQVPLVEIGGISAVLLGGLSSESNDIYVQCQCSQCIGKPSNVGLRTLEQHVEHVTGDEVPAGTGNGICRNFLFFKAHPEQMSFKNYMKLAAEQYDSEKLQGSKLWQFRFDKHVCSTANAAPRAGLWVQAELLGYDEKSGEHEVVYAAGSLLAGQRAKIFLGATPVHFADDPPAGGVSWNKRTLKWQVTLYARGRYRYFGSYVSQEEAACAYDRAALAAAATVGEGDLHADGADDMEVDEGLLEEDEGTDGEDDQAAGLLQELAAGQGPASARPGGRFSGAVGDVAVPASLPGFKKKRKRKAVGKLFTRKKIHRAEPHLAGCEVSSGQAADGAGGGTAARMAVAAAGDGGGGGDSKAAALAVDMSGNAAAEAYDIDTAADEDEAAAALLVAAAAAGSDVHADGDEVHDEDDAEDSHGEASEDECELEEVGTRRSQRQAARKAQKKTARRMASVVNARSDGLWARLMQRAGSDTDSDDGSSHMDGLQPGDLEAMTAVAQAAGVSKDAVLSAHEQAVKLLEQAQKGRARGRGRGRGRGRRGRPPGSGITARLAELHAQFVALGGFEGNDDEQQVSEAGGTGGAGVMAEDEELGDDDADVAALLLGLTGAAGTGVHPAEGEDEEAEDDEMLDAAAEDEQGLDQSSKAGPGGARGEKGASGHGKHVDEEDWAPRSRGRGLKGKGSRSRGGRGGAATAGVAAAAASSSGAHYSHHGQAGSWGGVEGGRVARMTGAAFTSQHQQQQAAAAAAMGNPMSGMFGMMVGGKGWMGQAAGRGLGMSGMWGLQKQQQQQHKLQRVSHTGGEDEGSRSEGDVMFNAFTTGSPKAVAEFQALYTTLNTNPAAMSQVMALLFQFGTQMGANLAASGQAPSMAAALSSMAAGMVGGPGDGSAGQGATTCAAGTAAAPGEGSLVANFINNQVAGAAEGGGGGPGSDGGSGGGGQGTTSGNGKVSTAGAAENNGAKAAAGGEHGGAEDGSGSRRAGYEAAAAASPALTGQMTAPAVLARQGPASASAGVTLQGGLGLSRSQLPGSGGLMVPLQGTGAVAGAARGASLTGSVWPPVVTTAYVGGVPPAGAAVGWGGFNPSAAAAAAVAAGMPAEYVNMLMGLGQLEEQHLYDHPHNWRGGAEAASTRLSYCRTAEYEWSAWDAWWCCWTHILSSSISHDATDRVPGAATNLRSSGGLLQQLGDIGMLPQQQVPAVLQAGCNVAAGTHHISEEPSVTIAGSGLSAAVAAAPAVHAPAL